MSLITCFRCPRDDLMSRKEGSLLRGMVPLRKENARSSQGYGGPSLVADGWSTGNTSRALFFLLHIEVTRLIITLLGTPLCDVQALMMT